jgi:hypothetical protein
MLALRQNMSAGLRADIAVWPEGEFCIHDGLLKK